MLAQGLSRLIDRVYGRFERLLDPYQAYDDTKPPPADLRAFYAEYLTPSRKLILVSILLGAAVAIMDALLIQFAGRLVDLLSTSSPETFWAEHGDTMLWMGVLVVVVRPLAIALDRLIMGQGFYPNSGALIRWRTHRHMLRQSVSFFHDDFAGRIANKQIQLAPAFNDVVFQCLDALLYAGVFVLASAAMFADTDARLLIPLGIWFAMYIATAFWFLPRVTETGKETAEARSRLAGRIVDSYTNIQTVKLFAHAEREEAYAKDALEDMRRAFAGQTRVFSTLTIVLTLVNTFLIAGVIGYGVWLWSGGSITVGAIAAASALVLRLQGMTEWIMWTLSQMFQNIGVVQEGVETVSQPLRLVDTPGARPLTVTGGAIRFEGVRHRYGTKAGAGVDGVTLEIRSGEKVGLVGRSGAGKSTLVNLLLRFFDPEEGRILIDGQDIRHATQDSVRAAIGMVTQDTSLLHRSILDNIQYGAPADRIGADPSVLRDAAIEAARKVSADEFVRGLVDKDGRDGYGAYVGERGVKLSGGQRQRIALARIVLKDAPILVLDEATSALDSEVEAAILEAMDDLMRGKTVIAIAHRLSTIARMDRIVVLDRGRVIEDGPHSALLAQGGLYAKLWSRQSGGFIDARAEGAAAEAAE